MQIKNKSDTQTSCDNFPLRHTNYSIFVLLRQVAAFVADRNSIDSSVVK